MNSNLIVIYNTLKKLCEKNKQNKFRYYTNNNVYNSKFLFFNNILLDERISDNPYKNILFNYLIKAERYIPGGSYILSEMFIDIINSNNGISSKRITGKKLETFEKLIKQFVLEEQNRKLIFNVLNFSGADASILCSPTKNSEIEIKKNKQPKIEVSLHEDFRGIYFSNQSTTTKDFISVSMDAYIERESEINEVFEYAKKENLPIVLFCRGVSDSAVRNIKNILLMNNIKLYPYIIKFDNNDPFLLSDISKALGTKILSVESGGSFNKNLVENSSINKLRLSPSFIEIFNPEELLLKEINKKMSETSDKDLLLYLNKRKKRISPNIVEVKIPEKDIRLINEFKSIIKYYNNAAISGFTIYNDMLYPRNTISALEKLAVSMKNNFQKIGYVLKIKDNDK